MKTIFRHLALAAMAWPAVAHAEAFQDLDAVDAKAQAIFKASMRLMRVRPKQQGRSFAL